MNLNPPTLKIDDEILITWPMMIYDEILRSLSLLLIIWKLFELKTVLNYNELK